MHKQLYIKRSQVEIVPYYVYMITIWPSLIYSFSSFTVEINRFHYYYFFFYHAVSADIVMFKNSIGNVALLSIDNFPQHLNAVHVFFSPKH